MSSWRALRENRFNWKQTECRLSSFSGMYFRGFLKHWKHWQSTVLPWVAGIFFHLLLQEKFNFSMPCLQITQSPTAENVVLSSEKKFLPLCSSEQIHLSIALSDRGEKKTMAQFTACHILLTPSSDVVGELHSLSACSSAQWWEDRSSRFKIWLLEPTKFTFYYTVLILIIHK